MPLPEMMNPPVDMKQLAPLMQPNNQRPLDPNGIDVFKELGVMQKAWEMSGWGQKKEEVGYSIFPTDVGYGHSGFYRFPGENLSIPARKDSLAIVHTHPKGQDPRPGPKDPDAPFPNYVFSGDALYVTNPKTKKWFKYDIDKWGWRELRSQLGDWFVGLMVSLLTGTDV